MSLTFLNPFFLLGLAAGMIPILIHRLTQRKAVSRKFSAVRLLLQSQQVTTKPQRLKHLLLLVLRILTVIILVFMIARPVLIRPGLLTLGNETPKVLILDNSMSMGYVEDDGRRYDLAKRAAKEIIEGLKGQVMIIPTSTSEGGPIQGSNLRWLPSGEALKVLASLPLSFGRGDPGAALSLAYQRLKEIKMPGEILFLSDMVRGDWEEFDLNKLGIVSSEAGISFLRIGGPTRDPNFALKGVEFAEGETVVGVPARLDAAVSNLSDQSGNVLVQIYMSGTKKDQKSIGLKAGEEGRVSFELLFDQPGWVDGEVRLSGDRLPLDDQFYFTLKVREKTRVLIIDGDPKTSLKASESYYLVNALRPGGSERSPFITRVTTEEELSSLDLKPYDAFFILNVARPEGFRLSSILESGRPLFIFLGDRVVAEKYNSFPFFPWIIREVREGRPLRPERISQIDSCCEALKSFSGIEGRSLRSASFQRYFKIDGSTNGLLTLENGDPLLVETYLQKGKLFLFASTADLDWNDLPLKAPYLPLIQGLLKEAVGFHQDSLGEGIRSSRTIEEKVQPFQVTGLQGAPDINRFFLPSGEVKRGLNSPFKESDLSKVSQEEIQKKFGRIETKMVEYREGAFNGIRTGRKELWPPLLAFVLVILAVEMGIANGLPKTKRDPDKEVP
jgi:hypothetical protein